MKSKVIGITSVLLLLGLGYSYTKSTITQNETLVTYTKIWNQYYRHLYPLKLEYFTIIGTRALTDAIKPPQDSLLYKLSKRIRIKTYEKAASALPEDDLLLHILRLNTEIDTQYVNEQNVGKMYDQLIAMARVSITKQIRLRDMSTEDKLYDSNMAHWIFLTIVAYTMVDFDFLKSLKSNEPKKYTNIAKEFCQISDSFKTIKTLYIPFDITCLDMMAAKYAIDYEEASGCNSSDMSALITQFNEVIKQLTMMNSHYLSRNYNSKYILSGLVDGIMLFKNNTSSTCPNRAKEFKSLPNNLM